MIRLYVSILFAIALLASAGSAKAALTLSYAHQYHTIPPNSTDLMDVSCPAGTKVVSGGWDAQPSQGRYLMVWVSRQVANMWRIMTVNKHPTAHLSITGYAVCASGVSGLSSYVASEPVNVPGGITQGGNASCPSGGLPTGGGFDSNFPNPAHLIPTGTYPNPQGLWYSQEFNSTSTSKSFTAFISCTTNLPAAASVTARWGTAVSFRNGSSVLASMDCGSGEVAIGGGHLTSITTGSPSATTQLVRTTANRPDLTNPRRWTVRGYNANQFDTAYIVPVVQCLDVN